MKSRNLPFSVSPALLAGVAVLCLATPARAAVAVAAPVPAPAPAPASTAVIPPDLAALEQQMSKLDVTSERFSMILDLGSVNFGGVPLDFVFGGSGEIGLAPQVGDVTFALLGQGSKLRLVGTTTYTYEPLIASYDGHRPWVRAENQQPAQLLGVGANPLLSTAPSAGVGEFTGLVNEINGAQSILEVGPAIVEGQRVSEFMITLDPSQLASSVSGVSSQLLGQAKKLHVSSLKLDLFLASNGLPARTSLVIGEGQATASVTIDVLAVNIPVVVHAPPAGQTIGAAQLRKLQEQRAKRQRKRLQQQIQHLRKH